VPDRQFKESPADFRGDLDQLDREPEPQSPSAPTSALDAKLRPSLFKDAQGFLHDSKARLPTAAGWRVIDCVA